MNYQIPLDAGLYFEDLRAVYPDIFLQVYPMLVRLVYKDCVQTWALYTTCDVDKLEKVQEDVTISGLGLQRVSYTNYLQALKVFFLIKRQLLSDLI